jgi:Hsp70 protein
MSASIEQAGRVRIAIDFGTSRSGYGFAFNDRQIHLRTLWPDQPVPYAKTLTNLLCSPEGKVDAWGYTARTELARLRKQGADGGYHLLRDFKPHLHTGKRTDKGPIVTQDGKNYLVVNLIAAYLKRLKDYGLQQLQGGLTGLLSEQDVQWLLTVPAMWTDEDKQWMRQAAQMAGLVGSDPGEADRLRLVLEPEAAAIYCQEQDGGSNLSDLRPGVRFLVVDAGGGTVDTVVLEVGPDGDLHQVVASDASLHGSTRIDCAFVRHLKERMGAEVLDQFRDQEPFGWVKLMDAWEQAKINYRPGQETTCVQVPVELYRLLAKKHATADGYFYLDRETMDGLFGGVVEEAAATARRQLERAGGRCDYLFLVGGFAASPLLQERIKNEFDGPVKRIVIPPNPGVAVLAGAVAYGLNPLKIRTRRSQLTYGCRVIEPFAEGIDPESKKVWNPEMQGWRCRERLLAFVRAGEAVEVGREVVHTLMPERREQTQMHLLLHACPRAGVRYTDEEQMALIGRLTVKMPDTARGLDRRLKVSFSFGGTEITVVARDLTSGEEVRTALTFASNPPKLADDLIPRRVAVTPKK